MTVPTKMRLAVLIATAFLAASACSFSFSTDDETTTDETEAEDQSTTSSTATSSTATTASTTTSSGAETDESTTTAEAASGSGSVGDIELVRETAERFITTTIADQYGAPIVEPSCPDVPGSDVGTTFMCTAKTEGGETIKLDASIDEGDELNIVTTNLVLAEFLPELERIGAQVLDEAGGGSLTIDCGSESVILDDVQEMVCDTADGGSVTYTIDDTTTGDFQVRIN